MAGGPKYETELEVFNFVHDGIQRGAIGVNLGRNVWQHPHSRMKENTRGTGGESNATNADWNIRNSLKLVTGNFQQYSMVPGFSAFKK